MINRDDWEFKCGNAVDVLKSMPDKSVQMCVTSPPYYNLRDYGTARWEGGDPNCPHYRTSKFSENTCTGHKAMGEQGQPVGDAIYKTVCPLCGAVRIDEQIGLEETPEEYIDNLVKVFREVRRVLKDDGTLWVNIGDTYNGAKHGNTEYIKRPALSESSDFDKKVWEGAKAKDLIGIPWMLAFALRADGWYLRQDIIWCLSGGAYVYAKTAKGEMPLMVRELSRLDISKVQLWNGSQWVNITGFQESNLYNDKVEIVLRSGERIGCTDGHRWVLANGEEKVASDLKVGDILKYVGLPDQEKKRPQFLTDDVLWFLGLYLAEGSRSDDCIQIALNSDEFSWYERIDRVARYFGGTSTYTLDGNSLNIRIYSNILGSVLHKYIGGKTAKNKHLTNSCWMLQNSDLKIIANGYFDGDGHYEDGRIRLGFTRNYDLERDLRILAARLNAVITLIPTVSICDGKKYPSFRGEWRWESSGHFNCKDRSEIVEIRRSRARHFYDISVDSDDHTFALASGILTHNCKKNPMPESVKDRCTKSHEYIFLLSKSPNYLFNYEDIQEVATGYDGRKDIVLKGSPKYDGELIMPGNSEQSLAKGGHDRWKFKNLQYDGQTPNTMHELRAQGLPDKIYTKKVPTNIAFGGTKYGESDDSHYQTYSGKAWEQKVISDGTIEVPIRNKRDVWSITVAGYAGAHFATYPEELVLPCILAGSNEGDTVLDPFNGAGTTGIVAIKNGRKYIGIDLNPEYIELAEQRFDETFFRAQKVSEPIIEDGMRKVDLLEE